VPSGETPAQHRQVGELWPSPSGRALETVIKRQKLFYYSSNLTSSYKLISYDLKSVPSGLASCRLPNCSPTPASTATRATCQTQRQRHAISEEWKPRPWRCFAANPWVCPERSSAGATSRHFSKRGAGARLSPSVPPSASFTLQIRSSGPDAHNPQLAEPCPACGEGGN